MNVIRKEQGIAIWQEPHLTKGINSSDKIHICNFCTKYLLESNLTLTPLFRTKLQKERERDISEQIALGLPAKNISSDVQFDQRLFNTTKGMDSGYGDDSSYNVYDKPWRSTADIGQHIYRPSKNIDKDIYGDDIDKIIKTNRYNFYLLHTKLRLES